jgi:hypothetical protein
MLTKELEGASPNQKQAKRILNERINIGQMILQSSIAEA